MLGFVCYNKMTWLSVEKEAYVKKNNKNLIKQQRVAYQGKIYDSF